MEDKKMPLNGVDVASRGEVERKEEKVTYMHFPVVT